MSFPESQDPASDGRRESRVADHLRKPMLHDLVEFSRIEWLQEIGLRAEADGANGQILRFRCGDDDDGKMLVGLSYLVQHVQPVDSGNADVQQHPGKSALPNRLQSLGAIDGSLDVVAGGAQTIYQELPDVGIVIHDQKASLHGLCGE